MVNVDKLGKRLLSLVLAVIMLVSYPVQAVASAADGSDASQIGPTYLASQADGTIGSNVVDGNSAVSVEDGKVVVNKTVSAVQGSENVFDITLSVDTKDAVVNQILEPDAAVVLVFDTSASMSETLADGRTRLSAAKEAAQMFINNFASDNPNVERKIAIAQFYKDAFLVQSWTDASSLKTNSNKSYCTPIRNLVSDGHSGTNIEGGLLIARNLLNNAGDVLSGIENRTVILLSDGGANACVVGADEKDKYDINYTGKDLFGYSEAQLYGQTQFTGFYGNADYHFHHGGAVEAAASLPSGVPLKTV